MKRIWIAAAVLTATLAVTGCKHRKEEPIPGPKAGWSTMAQTQLANASARSSRTAARHDARDHHGASGISWFQGTLEEAFSPTCHKCASLFRPLKRLSQRPA
jgi:hypothetical protein